MLLVLCVYDQTPSFTIDKLKSMHRVAMWSVRQKASQLDQNQQVLLARSMYCIVHLIGLIPSSISAFLWSSPGPLYAKYYTAFATLSICVWLAISVIKNDRCFGSCEAGMRKLLQLIWGIRDHLSKPIKRGNSRRIASCFRWYAR